MTPLHQNQFFFNFRRFGGNRRHLHPDRRSRCEDFLFHGRHRRTFRGILLFQLLYDLRHGLPFKSGHVIGNGHTNRLQVVDQVLAGHIQLLG